MAFEGLARAILNVIDPQTADRDAARDRIEWRTVDAVLHDGRYQVGADVLSTIGHAKLTAGERAAVLIQRGTAVGILAHQAKRAQGGAGPSGGAAEIEMLFLAYDALGVGTVYFRNADQVTPVVVGAPGGGFDIGGYGWGARDDTFWVQRWEDDGRPCYDVYTLNREEHEPLGDTVAEATLVKTIHLPTLPFDGVAALAGATNNGTPFPLDLSHGLRPFLTRDLDMVVTGSITRTTTAGHLGPTTSEAYAVSTKTNSLVWQSGAVPALGFPDGPGPELHQKLAYTFIEASSIVRWGDSPADQLIFYQRALFSDETTDFGSGVFHGEQRTDLADVSIVTSDNVLRYRRDYAGRRATTDANPVTSTVSHSGIIDLWPGGFNGRYLLLALKQYDGLAWTGPRASTPPVYYGAGTVTFLVVDVDTGAERVAYTGRDTAPGVFQPGILNTPQWARFRMTQPLVGSVAYLREELRHTANIYDDPALMPPRGVDASEAGHIVLLDSFDPLQPVGAEFPDYEQLADLDGVPLYEFGWIEPAYQLVIAPDTLDLVEAEDVAATVP